MTLERGEAASAVPGIPFGRTRHPRSPPFASSDAKRFSVDLFETERIARIVRLPVADGGMYAGSFPGFTETFP